MDKICGIYKITSPTGKIYIGQSRNINKRIYHYCGKLGIGQPKIHNSILKHGWENHDFEIICECDKSKLDEFEIYYIRKYNSFGGKYGLNLTEGGHNNNITNETKTKISDSLKGIKRSEETKLKIGKIPYITTTEINNKISGSLKDIKRSEETKLKMRESKIGKYHSQESKNKISSTKSSTYTIYTPNNKILYKFHGNIKKKLKEFGFPEHTFCNTYRNNTKIKNDEYVGWYIIRE